ncbi:hypothetical protein EI94DRAFT_1815257 [Lactarius quietus]|nr:hypothetical protein EI94DRAFT_1815257 [Lactarius quietus]
MASSDPEAQVVSGPNDRPDGTTVTQPGDNTNTRSVENYGDPSGKLWSMYLTEAKKEDEQITSNWTEDTQGVLVFQALKTGLFSSIIATFISISLPQLSPDPKLRRSRCSPNLSTSPPEPPEYPPSAEHSSFQSAASMSGST